MPEPDLGAGGFAGRRGGGAGGGARPQGPSWMTGGLNFETSGIKNFTTEIRNAAKAVKDLFAPFAKVKQLGKDVDDFFAKLKTNLKETSKLSQGVQMPGQGAQRAQAAGGTRTSVAPPEAKPPAMPNVPGRSFNNGGQQQPGGLQQARMALSGRAPSGGFSTRPAGIAAATLGTAAILGRSANRMLSGDFMGSIETGDLAAYYAAQRAGQGGYGGTGYLSQIRQIRFGGQRGAFAGQLDRAQAASAMFNLTGFGPNTPTVGGGNVMGSIGGFGLLNPTLSGVQQAQLGGSLYGPQAVNAMQFLGVNATPGGRPRSQQDIFNQLMPKVFGGSTTPTAAQLQYAGRPGTGTYAAIQQLFGGDEGLTQAFLQHAGATSQLGRPLQTTEAGYAQDLRRAGVTQTVLGRERRVGDVAGQAQATTAEGVVKAINKSNDWLEKIYGGILQLGQAHPGAAGAIGQGVGYGSVAGRIAGGAEHALGLGGQIGGMWGLGLGARGIARGIGRMTGGGAAASGGGAAGGGVGAGSAVSTATQTGGGAALTGGLGVAAPLLGGVAVGLGAEHLIQGRHPTRGRGILGKTALGAATGAGIGLAGGPFAEISVPVGAAVGAAVGFVGGLMSSSGGDTAQERSALQSAGLPFGSVAEAFRHLDDMTTDQLIALQQLIGPHAGASAIQEEVNRRLHGQRFGSSRYQASSNAQGTLTTEQFGDAGAIWPWRVSGAVGDADPAQDPSQMGSIRGPGRVMGMSGSLVSKLKQLFAADQKAVLTSGFRTRQEQANLYARDPNIAAPPGQSKHEIGLAADVDDGQGGRWLSAHAKEFGLYQPMPSKEPWHLEESGGSTAPTPAAKGEEQPPSSAASSGSGGLWTRYGNQWALFGSAPASTSGAAPASTSAPTSSPSKPTPTTSGGASGGDIQSQILQVGTSLGATQKMLLAAFETGIVESGMRNLSGGDRDSAGVFQQRPSQGWGTFEQVTDVKYAATQFFNRAAGYHKEGNAGAMAQAVQRSAYPDRYDKARPQAVSMLANLGIDVSQIGDPVPSPSNRMSAGNGMRPQIVVQNMKIELSIANASYEEATRFVQHLKTALSDEEQLLRLGTT